MNSTNTDGQAIPEVSHLFDLFEEFFPAPKPGPSNPNATATVIRDARRRLEDSGIILNLDEESVHSIATSGCDKRTINQSLVLAQILLEHRPISVRGAFYRAVSCGLYPNTAKTFYRQASNIILKLRRAQLIPYSWIADSTRSRKKPSSWTGLQEFGETVLSSYRKDFWSQQESYLEVFCEKDAMAGVLAPVTDEYDIALNVIRGNSSETFIWSCAEILKKVEKPTYILYFGDFDPNGLDIERDIRSRLNGFLGGRTGSPTIETPINRAMIEKYYTDAPFWTRVAINKSDFDDQTLLGFPTRQSIHSKAWGTRCENYISEYGDRCVEVDAVAPGEIRRRLKQIIESHIDQASWQKLKTIEEAEKDTIIQAFGGLGAKCPIL